MVSKSNNLQSVLLAAALAAGLVAGSSAVSAQSEGESPAAQEPAADSEDEDVHREGEAEEPAEDDTDDTGEGEGEDRTSLFAVPGIFYTQETGLAFAGFLTYDFPMPGIGRETWASSLNLALVYTLKKQASATLWPSFYFGRANDWMVGGEYVVKHFPDRFFGEGNETNGDYQAYTERQVQLRTRFRRRLTHSFYIGAFHELTLTDVRDVEPIRNADGLRIDGVDESGFLTGDRVVGRDGSRVHGLGLSLARDTRDNHQSARSGAFYSIELTGYPLFLGSEYGFLQAVFDNRWYVPVADRHVFAFQLLAELRSGDVPFTSQSELGGDSVLRGLYEGRFRDYNALVAQFEYRLHIIWRLGMVAFASAGEVFRRFDDLRFDAVTWTAGGGLRGTVNEETRSTIRLDVAGGPDGFGFIFFFGEAF